MTLTDITPELICLVVFILFAVFAGIQLIYLWGVFSRFAFYRKKAASGDRLPVSVVISAKNEFYNLQANLPLILEQDYPDFEVVVVNDSSEDETLSLLEDFARKYRHLKIVNIAEDLNFFQGKKFPLSIGIKSSENDILLLTDADCAPVSPHWISEMVSQYSDGTEIVLGYGKYKNRRSLLNLLIRYETIFTAQQYFSYTLAGLPYMGVGRNLSYRKSLFYKNKGFISHYKIHSGDDDLFINKVANKSNTRIETSPDSFTISEPKRSFASWWHQKRRHQGASGHYKAGHKFLLGFYLVSLALFYGAFTASMFLEQFLIASCVILGVRLISQLLLFKNTMLRLKEKNLLLISPLLEIIFLLIYFFLAVSNLVRKQDTWK